MHSSGRVCQRQDSSASSLGAQISLCLRLAELRRDDLTKRQSKRDQDESRGLLSHSFFSLIGTVLDGIPPGVGVCGILGPLYLETDRIMAGNGSGENYCTLRLEGADGVMLHSCQSAQAVAPTAPRTIRSNSR